MSDLGDSICGMSNDEVLFNLNHSKEFRLGGDGIAKEVKDPVPVSRYLIAVMWTKQYGKKFSYSMRSHSEHGPDVSAIAKSFVDGGGHSHAARFLSERAPEEIFVEESVVAVPDEMCVEENMIAE